MSKLARRSRKRYKSNPAPKSNPPLLTDLVEWGVPAGASFAVTRLLTKLGVMLIAKKWPSKAKHGGAAASVGAFAVLYYLSTKWKWLTRYQGPAVAGSAIGTVVNLLQLYVPKVGWLVGDPTELTAGGTAASKAVAQGAQAAQLPAGMEEIEDDPSWYTYNDAYDAGRYNAQPGATKQQASQPTEPPALEDETWGGNNVFAGGLAGN